MTDIIKTPEYWAQPGEVRYTYKHRMEKTLWNVSRFNGQTVTLWTINAWGSTREREAPRITFGRDYERHNRPSLYEQMRTAT